MNAHPADNDMARVGTLVRELLDEFPHPDTGKALPGLLGQAWAPSLRVLTARQPQDIETGHAGKPGSRPPVRLDLWSHVQACLDMAREEADDLGAFVNGADGEIALRRLPALLEPTLDDCRGCARCSGDERVQCQCRHRKVTKRVGWHHSTLRTALGWQEPRSDRRDICCPQCGRPGKVSVRLEQEKIWCRFEDCDWMRVGALAILAYAA